MISQEKRIQKLKTLDMDQALNPNHNALPKSQILQPLLKIPKGQTPIVKSYICVKAFSVLKDLKHHPQNNTSLKVAYTKAAFIKCICTIKAPV